MSTDIRAQNEKALASVKAIYDAAEQAKADASRAQSAADEAEGHAQTALTNAATAQGAAEAANTAASNAQTSANNALTQLSTIESVVDTLDWITSHSEITADTTVVSGKSYYIKNADNTFTKVADPTGNPHSQGWYEMDEAISDYVAAHLSLTDYGLNLTLDNTSYRVHIGTYTATGDDGVYIIDGSGNVVSYFGENIRFSSARQQYIGNNNAYILFDPTGQGSLTIGGATIQIGTKTLDQVLADKADTDDIPTKVSDLTNDSDFATTTQVSTAKSEAINTAANDATSKANAAQAAAEATAAADATSKANAAQSAAEATASADATAKANAAEASAKSYTDDATADMATTADVEDVSRVLDSTVEGAIYYQYTTGGVTYDVWYIPTDEYTGKYYYYNDSGERTEVAESSLDTDSSGDLVLKEVTGLNDAITKASNEATAASAKAETAKDTADDALTAADNAAMTATSFITAYGSSGIMVHDSEDDTTGVHISDVVSIIRDAIARVVVDSEGLTINTPDGKAIAKYGDTAVIGDENDFHVVISDTQLGFYQGDVRVAYLSNNQLYITQSVVLKQMAVGSTYDELDEEGNHGAGKWTWQVHKNASGKNNLGLRWNF